MFRTNLLRLAVMLSGGTALFVATESSARAGLFSRLSGSSCNYYSGTSHSSGNSGMSGGSSGGSQSGYGYVSDPEIVRQVRVIYFSTQFNAWFEADAVVPPAGASIGLSAVVTVPRVGVVRGWVVRVYRQPVMTSPYRTEKNDAATTDSNGGDGEAVQEMGSLMQARGTELASSSRPALASHPSKTVNNSPQRSLFNGYVRLWTNRAGTRRAFAELLEIRKDSVLLRDADGTIFNQSFANLSDDDVTFLRNGALPVSTLVSLSR